MLIKVHIERDFSFMEFEVDYDLQTGVGLPPVALLQSFWDSLPGKPAAPKEVLPPPRGGSIHPRGTASRAPQATAAQRRVLERHGQWRDGLTQEEASSLLTSLGF